MSPLFDLHYTSGVTFLGVVIAATLHGVSIVQAWYYYGHQSDTWALKSLVGAVMIFETIHQAMITHSSYTHLVTNWGDPGGLDKLVWSSKLEVLFNGLTAFLVQSFLTMRVWRFSNGKIWLTSLIALLVLAEFGCLLSFTTLVFHMDTFDQLLRLKALAVTINILAAAGDVLIAGTLCTLLHLSRTGFHRSDTMINKLMLFAVNTGLLSSLFAVASLVSILFASHTFFYIAFFICMGRLYANALLATLNARKMIRNCADSITNSTGDRMNIMSLRDFPKKQAGNISIKINTTKEFVTDLSDNHHDHDQDVDKTDSCSTEFLASGYTTNFSHFQTSSSNVQMFEKNKV